MRLPRIRFEQWRWLLFCGVPYLAAALLGGAAALAGWDWLEEACDDYLQELRRVK